MKKNVSRPIAVLLATAMIFCLWRCETPSRGCLDIEATNFAFSADKPCEDGCCTYPNLVLIFNQEFDGEVWLQDKTYVNDLGQPFVIRSASFYFSGFELSQQGQQYNVSDTLSLKTWTGTDSVTVNFVDDFVLGRRIPLEYPVGTFRKSGFFDEFRCQLGLSPTANNIVSSKTPSGHPLNKQADSLWLNNTDKFVWMQIAYKKDTLAATPTDTLRFGASDFGGQPFVIARPGNFEHQTGTDFRISMTLDYGLLFKGINLANIGQSELKAKIISALNGTFEVE
jgi:hypothetical protein